MGVLFAVSHQVRRALIPFCRTRGVQVEAQQAKALYLEASRGRLSSADLWRALGVEGDAEDLDRAYVAMHTLAPGALAFCDRAAALGIELACVTNHLTEWVAGLRAGHDLDRRIPCWIVSAEVGARKPDLRLFEALLRCSGRKAQEIVLVDDLPRNVRAAVRYGLGGVLFGERDAPPLPRARDFAELGRLLLSA
jgi:FMN phosphatase YigB (HAD superfamily)